MGNCNMCYTKFKKITAMEEDTKPYNIHIAPAHHSISWHVWVLFIPAIAFGVIVALVFSSQPRQVAQTTQGSAVLGDQITK